jgi:hypothetical protein
MWGVITCTNTNHTRLCSYVFKTLSRAFNKVDFLNYIWIHSWENWSWRNDEQVSKIWGDLPIHLNEIVERIWAVCFTYWCKTHRKHIDILTPMEKRVNLDLIPNKIKIKLVNFEDCFMQGCQGLWLTNMSVHPSFPSNKQGCHRWQTGK